MNARIVNLRTARKRKAREAAKEAADRRALEHGRTKAEKRATGAENARVSKVFEGHRRGTPGDGDPDGGPDGGE